MIGYQPQTQPRYAARYMGQEVAPAAAPAAAPTVLAPSAPLLDWNREEVKTAAIAQGVALAYALTASYFYNKRGDFINRVILGVGSLAFGAAGWASYRMMAAKPSNTPTQVTGGVFGTLDAVTALGALFATFRPKKTAGALAQAIANGLPV